MRHTEKRNKIAGSLIAFCLLASFRCVAQVPRPSFDVASVRASTSELLTNTVQATPGGLTIRNGTLGFLILWAYDVPYSRMNGPAWLPERRFDVVAKAANAADEAHLRLMLQTLLADRFGLTAHREQQAMQVYALTLAKGGPKFQESATDGPSEIERTNPALLAAHHISLGEIAEQISRELGRPVVDKTGLTRRYEIRMDLTPYVTRAAGAGDGQLDLMSILFTGLQDLLGLKLEPGKDTVEMLVIDHAEKTPTGN